MARIDTELLGLQIVSLEDASIVGEVDGLIIDDASMAVAGFLVDLGLYEASVLPFASASSVGNDAIIVPSAAALKSVTADAALEALAKKDITISDAKAITRSGKTVGIIGDFFVDTATGAIEGMEFIASEQTGYHADVSVLPTVGVIRLGRDIIVLADDYHQRLQRDATSLARLHREDTGTMTITPRGPALETQAEPAASAPAAEADQGVVEPPAEPEAIYEPVSDAAPEPEPQPDAELEPVPADVSGEAVDESAAPPAEEPTQGELQFAEPEVTEVEAEPAAEPAAEPVAEAAAIEDVTAEIENAPALEEPEAPAAAGPLSEETAPEIAPEPAQEEPQQVAAAAEAPAAASDDSFGTQQRHFLIGKRVLRRIESPSGEVVAEEGDLVTYEMIQKAKSSDQLLILSLNVE